MNISGIVLCSLLLFYLLQKRKKKDKTFYIYSTSIILHRVNVNQPITFSYKNKDYTNFDLMFWLRMEMLDIIFTVSEQKKQIQK